MRSTVDGPVTGTGLRAGLVGLGLAPGDVVLVHASLRAFGFVVGGPLTVVQALLDTVGPLGTLVVPTMTANNCDPSRWGRTWDREVPAAWWEAIRRSMPGHDPLRTPSVGMGAVAECVRTWPGSRRSAHPQTSFAALGPAAEIILGRHERDCHLGPDSPLGALYGMASAKVLLLGVGYDACTAFHLGEYHWPANDRRDYECVISEDGTDRWYRYQDVRLNDSDFASVGTDFQATTGSVRSGRVGAAEARLFPLSAGVDYAATWFEEHRRSPDPTS